MQRVRRSGRPFFRSRGRGFLARSGETGALRVERRFTPGGFNKCPRIERPYLGGPKARPQPRTRLRGRGGARRGQESATGRQAAQKASGPVIFAQQKGSERVAGGLGAPLEAGFGPKGRERGPPVAQSERFWAKIGLLRRVLSEGRSPKRGSEAGLGSRQSAAYRIHARPDPKPAGGGRKSAAECREEPRRPLPSASRPRSVPGSESTRSPAVDPDHEVCRDDGGARKGQPRRRLPTTKGVGTGGGAGAEAGAAITRAAPAARGQRSGAFTRLWRVAPRGKGEGRRKGPRSGGV